MKRDLSPSDFAGLVEQHEKRQELARHAFEANPSARKRFGWPLIAAAAPWIAIFVGFNAPALIQIFSK